MTTQAEFQRAQIQWDALRTKAAKGQVDASLALTSSLLETASKLQREAKQWMAHTQSADGSQTSKRRVVAAAPPPPEIKIDVNALPLGSYRRRLPTVLEYATLQFCTLGDCGALSLCSRGALQLVQEALTQTRRVTCVFRGPFDARGLQLLAQVPLFQARLQNLVLHVPGDDDKAIEQEDRRTMAHQQERDLSELVTFRLEATIVQLLEKHRATFEHLSCPSQFTSSLPIPTALMDCPRLKYLRVHHSNNDEAFVMKRLRRSDHLQHLETLDMNVTTIRSLHLSRLLERQRGLKTLRIYGLSILQARKLAMNEAIDWSHLKTLQVHVQQHKTGQADATAVRSLVERMPQLTSLDVSLSPFGGMDPKRVASNRQDWILPGLLHLTVHRIECVIVAPQLQSYQFVKYNRDQVRRLPSTLQVYKCLRPEYPASSLIAIPLEPFTAARWPLKVLDTRHQGKLRITELEFQQWSSLEELRMTIALPNYEFDVVDSVLRHLVRLRILYLLGPPTHEPSLLTYVERDRRVVSHRCGRQVRTHEYLEELHLSVGDDSLFRSMVCPRLQRLTLAGPFPTFERFGELKQPFAPALRTLSFWRLTAVDPTSLATFVGLHKHVTELCIRRVRDDEDNDLSDQGTFLIALAGQQLTSLTTLAFGRGRNGVYVFPLVAMGALLNTTPTLTALHLDARHANNSSVRKTLRHVRRVKIKEDCRVSLVEDDDDDEETETDEEE